MLQSAVLALVIGSPPPVIAVKTIKVFSDMRVLAISAAPTGARFAASLEDNSVKVMDAVGKKVLLSLDGHPQPVYGLAFNKPASRIATGDESARIWIWDAKSGRKIKEFPRAGGHIRGIQALSFSADGKLLASTGKDDVIIVWNVATGAQVKKIPGNGANFYGARFSPAGGILASGTLGPGARFMKPGSWSPIATLTGHGNQGVFDLAFDPRGTKVVTGGRDAKALVWDVKSRKRTGTLAGHEDAILHVDVSPNGLFAATSSNDRRVIVWDLKGMNASATLESQSSVGSPVAFTGDGKYLITANASDSLCINSLTPPVAGKKK